MVYTPNPGRAKQCQQPTPNPYKKFVSSVVNNLFAGSASRDIDWDEVIARAYAHGLLPLLNHHLSTIDRVPAQVRSQLKRESIAKSQHILHLVGKQLQIHNLFKKNGIPVAIFKGPLLAQM